MLRISRTVLFAALLLVATDLGAQQLAAPMSPEAMRTRLDAYAADSMRGRLTGTADNVKATRWIADELRKIGLEPAGDDGTFLQRVPLVRGAADTAASSIIAAGTTLRAYEDYVPRNQGPTGFGDVFIFTGTTCG
jgi:hypothetical protein